MIVAIATEASSTALTVSVQQTMALNPLATPKGVKILCELCQKPAYIQCTKCRVTYYCCDEHQIEDWSSIHEKICSIVAIARIPQSHAHTEEERATRKHQQELRKKHIIEVSLQEGRRFLYEGHHSMAIPAALEALKFLTEVYGNANIHLTPAYLILGAAAIGLGRLKEADQYLSQAQWSVLKAGDCEPWLKSRLHRNLGKLAAAKNSLSEARRHFAEDIYQSSVAYNLDAIQTSGGYYHMGQVFLKEKKTDIAISLHNQVLDAWKAHLSSLVHEKPGSKGQLDVAERAEAFSMLHSIREWRESVTAAHPQLMAPLYHTLALLHTTVGEEDKAIGYAEQALGLIKTSGQAALLNTQSELEQLIDILHKPEGTT
ncbi:zinc finger MYND domain-containing protein 12-like [Halichondria panicea]|uniref:zinc finger MYND domain-containing protein 12-like n=1 Tax=Halichondria panicea TaxID=6063 RepID=UPI00312BB5C5